MWEIQDVAWRDFNTKRGRDISQLGVSKEKRQSKGMSVAPEVKFNVAFEKASVVVIQFRSSFSLARQGAELLESAAEAEGIWGNSGAKPELEPPVTPSFTSLQQGAPCTCIVCRLQIVQSDVASLICAGRAGAHHFQPSR